MKLKSMISRHTVTMLLSGLQMYPRHCPSFYPPSASYMVIEFSFAFSLLHACFMDENDDYRGFFPPSPPSFSTLYAKQVKLK